ncbi:hypothetical protein C8A05DRAFT_15530, partial [Staphylotrichum tortipilum]
MDPQPTGPTTITNSATKPTTTTTPTAPTNTSTTSIPLSTTSIPLSTTSIPPSTTSIPASTTSTQPRPSTHTTPSRPPSTTPSSQSPLKKSPSWLTTKTRALTAWLATSEPSAQALSRHRKETFQHAGISPRESSSHAKLHAPIGEIPADAIRPGRGPTPEEVARRERRRR